jgi:pyruvate dehydrogenase (quinone)
VLKNNTLGQIRWEQMVFLGNPEYGCDLQPIDFAMAVRALGPTGISIDDPGRCRTQMQEAFAQPGPVLVEVVDPNTPPMPAKIKPEQALRFAQAMARGEPDRGAIMGTILKDRVPELV